MGHAIMSAFKRILEEPKIARYRHACSVNDTTGVEASKMWTDNKAYKCECSLWFVFLACLLEFTSFYIYYLTHCR